MVWREGDEGDGVNRNINANTGNPRNPWIGVLDVDEKGMRKESLYRTRGSLN